jgi:anti-sigma factor ChrR (cupin superfamily)
MSSPSQANGCDRAEELYAYAVQMLPAHEAAALEAHLASCAHCARELDALRPVAKAFTSWSGDVRSPGRSLRPRLAQRLAQETGGEAVEPSEPGWHEPQWEDVAPGISCKLLSNDDATHMVSMLVRLAPGAAYPPHTHAGIEELHLLDGELWIEERKLHPGDYNRGEPGTGDKRVWSETGCTCVLITSTEDVLR